MDSTPIHIILSNDQHGYALASEAARNALETMGFNWDSPDENGEPSSYYQGIGDAIADALREEFADVIGKYDLLGLILGDTLNHINWYEIGESFYEDAAESED
ncbi:hypothetical protein AB0K16_22195 [Nonomuraea jabiensis]|uniref:hypothetical protein n=1 Tax=Nonomuraea jabiensis TaxID=882448 RepID=UPI0034210DB0